ncbi:hypothetical protein CEK25_002366 [Fusarium fujikuroi]|nr:hypothetical protein CEK25_002366 [Fusarium fujikuroi]
MEARSQERHGGQVEDGHAALRKAAMRKALTTQTLPKLADRKFRQETARHNGTPGKKLRFYVLLRLIIAEGLASAVVKTAPARAAAVVTIVEDEQGQQQLEEDLSAVRHPAQDSVAVLKNPFFDKIAEGTYSLQVYHPSDIIWLEHHDERIPEQWRVHEKIKSNEEYHAEGTELTEKEHWLHALHSYTLAISTAGSPYEKQQALLGRSQVNFQLDRPRQALLDAIEGDGLLAASTEESLLLQARAIYHLGKFEECLEKLQALTAAFPKSVPGWSMKSAIFKRLEEQNDGEYSFDDMLVEAQETPPLIDRATFSSLVEIRIAPGRGKGLFLTKDVSAGDLILCEKVFSYCFMDEKSPETYPILGNLPRKEVTTGGSVRLWAQVIQKLYHNPEHIDTIQELSHGDQKKPQITECDGSPVVDSFMVEKITHYNAVNAPRTTSDDFETRVFHKSGDTLEIENIDTKFLTSGIWLLPSRINHSCVNNCRRSFIGDMQIIRATQDMSAGTELLLSYRAPCSFESYEEVQHHLSRWGFKCVCDLCKSRSKEDKKVLEKRSNIYGEALDLLKTEGKSSNKVRLKLSELCFGICDRYTESVMPVDFVKTTVKSLESLGFVIVAYIPGQKPDDIRFQVKKYGMSTNYVVYLFLNLAELYGQVSRQLSIYVYNYAIISYKMLVGEVASMGRLLSDVVQHFSSM